MFEFIKTTSILFLLLIIESLSCYALENKCKLDFKNFRALLECIEQNSPRILRSQALNREAEALPKQANQWLNPTLEFQALYASPSNPNGSTLQGFLLFPLDLSGVQTARILKAELEKKERFLSGRLSRQEVLQSSYLALHRIRQLNQQIEILETTSQSLKNLIATFQRRPKLSPEQEASHETLKLTLQEIQSRLEIYRQQSHGLAHDIEIELDLSWIPTLKTLPQSPLNWPKLSSTLKPKMSPTVERLQVSLQKEEATIRVVHAEKQPTLSIGPFLSWSRVATESGIQAGMAFQMPLPIIESYSGTQNLAERGRDRAKVELTTNLREIEGEINHSQEIYEGSVKALQNFEPVERSGKRVRLLENSFRQGLIPGASYLEMLRQDLSLRQIHDELENRALEAWCHIQERQNMFEECFL